MHIPVVSGGLVLARRFHHFFERRGMARLSAQLEERRVRGIENVLLTCVTHAGDAGIQTFPKFLGADQKLSKPLKVYENLESFWGVRRHEE